MKAFAVSKKSLREDHQAIRRWLRDAETALRNNDCGAYEEAMQSVEQLAGSSWYAAISGE
jgi:hypothetical protein